MTKLIEQEMEAKLKLKFEEELEAVKQKCYQEVAEARFTAQSVIETMSLRQDLPEDEEGQDQKAVDDKDSVVTTKVQAVLSFGENEHKPLTGVELEEKLGEAMKNEVETLKQKMMDEREKKFEEDKKYLKQQQLKAQQLKMKILKRTGVIL